MKVIKSLIKYTIIFCLLSACSSYVNNLHKKIDYNSGGKGRQTNGDNLDLSLFKKGKMKNNQLNNKDTLNSLNSKSIPNLYPNVKRSYASVKRRVTSEDLVDGSSNNASLWSDGQNSFLFSLNNHKKIGDIISIDVMYKLKQEIGLELSRLFSDGKRNIKSVVKNKNNKDGKDNKENKYSEKKDASTQQDQGQNQTASNQENKTTEESKKYNPITDDKTYDQIPGVISEELNRDYVIVQGRKEILYMNRKRYIEVKAIVARKDINDNYNIQSAKFLESNIKIIK
ncbi:MAG: flagellar basal body L-ring protein FlgH [Oligoflexia bacterium]|nr:flagellar basal body L-ring protein FlgH [Oligoflexia bacterium]